MVVNGNLSFKETVKFKSNNIFFGLFIFGSYFLTFTVPPNLKTLNGSLTFKSDSRVFLKSNKFPTLKIHLVPKITGILDKLNLKKRNLTCIQILFLLLIVPF